MEFIIGIMIRSRFKTPVVRSLLLLTLILCGSLNISSCNAAESENNSSRPTVALALGGGGTRGVAHIGVLRVLKEEGIPIDAVAGTSMGALIGGLYCAGLSCDEIDQIFHRRAAIHSFNTVPIWVRVAVIPITIMPRLFGHHPYEGLYRGNKFAKYLSKLVPPDKRNIENLRPRFWAVASNLLDGQAHAIKCGDFGRAIQASSAIPILRRPVEIGDMLMIDGGILENVPTEHARQMGCDYVIAVDVDARVMPVAAKTFRALGSVSNRVINMSLCKVDEPQLAMADAVIQPDLRGIKLLSYKPADYLKALHEGEEAARAAVPYLKEQLEELQKKKQKEQAALSVVEGSP
jgi:NTE family protein